MGRLLKDLLTEFPHWLRPPQVSEDNDADLACTLFVALGEKALAGYKTAAGFSAMVVRDFEIGFVPGECMWSPEELDGSDASAAGSVQAVRFGLGRANFEECLVALRAAFEKLDAAN